MDPILIGLGVGILISFGVFLKARYERKFQEHLDERLGR